MHYYLFYSCNLRYSWLFASFEQMKYQLPVGGAYVGEGAARAVAQC